MVEKAIRKHLIPALLEVQPEAFTDVLRTITLLSHGVKVGGLNLRNPKTGADRLFQASAEASAVLFTLLLDNTSLDLVEHRGCVRKVGMDARKEKVEREAAAVKIMMEGATRKAKNCLGRIRECGIWISMMPHKLHGTLLTRNQWQDNLRLQCALQSLAICSHFDRCGEGFSV